MQLKKKLSSYQKLKLKIEELEKACDDYSMAIRSAKSFVGYIGVSGANHMTGNEEMPIVRDPKKLTEIILKLPV